jgi:hypothetical protein
MWRINNPPVSGGRFGGCLVTAASDAPFISRHSKLLLAQAIASEAFPAAAAAVAGLNKNQCCCIRCAATDGASSARHRLVGSGPIRAGRRFMRLHAKPALADLFAVLIRPPLIAKMRAPRRP